MQLSKLPSSVELRRFVARGQAVYGVGLARSQVQRKTNIVAARWGADTRPRVTLLWPGDAVDAKPEAALVREYMAVVWGQRADDGKSHTMLGIVDLEQTLAGPIHDLRAAQGRRLRRRSPPRTTLSWRSGPTTRVSRASASTGPWQSGWRGRVANSSKTPVTCAVAIVCAGRTWLLRDASPDQLAMWSLDQAGHSLRGGAPASVY